LVIATAEAWAAAKARAARAGFASERVSSSALCER
jgi:hypothetical protein